MQQMALNFELVLSNQLFSVVLAAYKWFKISSSGVWRRHMWQLDMFMRVLNLHRCTVIWLVERWAKFNLSQIRTMVRQCNGKKADVLDFGKFLSILYQNEKPLCDVWGEQFHLFRFLFWCQTSRNRWGWLGFVPIQFLQKITQISF